MEGESILQTIAEVSVAFAGFTGVVVAFGRRSHGPWLRVDLLRFRAMIVTSLQALLFSLFPFLLHHAGVSEALLWRPLSALLMVGIGAGAALDYMQIAGLGRREIPRFERVFSRTLAPILCGATLVYLGLDVLGLVERAFAPYLAGLFFCLLMASVMFVRLLTTDVTPGARESGP